MKIVVDINHPAHVHYFKNFIWEMEKRGHEILVTASEKDISFELLKIYKIPYINIGSYGKGIAWKIINLPILDWKMYKAVKKFNPDIFLGFGSIRAAHVSKILGKPCIALDDTEHAKWEHMLYVPFTDAILTPKCFKKDFGKKQIRYDGYTELAYLHPNYFSPNPSVLDEIGLTPDEIFIILRFVSWDANHDVGHHGILDKIGLVKEIEKYGRVLITSEEQLPVELEKYKIKISPEKLHDLLCYATLYVGEGATTASECAILGTYAIYINTIRCGVQDEEEKKYGILYNVSDPAVMENKTIELIHELLNQNNLITNGKNKRDLIIENSVDLTQFIIDYVEENLVNQV